MLLSKKLLEKFYPVFKKISLKEIEKTLLLIGCEIESVFTFDKIENLVVGQIIEFNKHPNSNKLNVCKVKINDKETKTIICGANNLEVGRKVIVAQKGAKMANGLTIDYREIMGIKSEGMMCGYDELTTRVDFTSDYDKTGIILLDENAIVGDKNPLNYINFDDFILDVSIPSNRNDLNGIIGIANDLLSILKPDEIEKTDFDFSDISDAGIKVEKNEFVNFFGAIKIKDVEIKQSSWQMKSLLMNSGIKPINSIVDLSNMIMVLSANPTHAYDAKHIGKNLTVTKLKDNTKLLALDKKEYNFTKDTLVVESENKTVAIAGIIGLDHSSVNENTKTVIFEIANFNNQYIFNTSNKMNFKTSASVLFSKKIPLWTTLKAFEIAINIFKSANNFKLDSISYTDVELQPKKIPYSYNHIIKLLGMNIDEKTIKKYLTNLGFIVNKEFIISIDRRNDINNIHDVVEEILKVIDVNNIDPQPILSSQINMNENYENNNIEKVNNYFQMKGFSLTKTYNLTSLKTLDKYNLFNAKKFIKIINPISNEKEYIRTSLIGQMINVYEYNNSYKNELIPIFELQKLNYDDKEKYHLSFLSNSQIFFNNINKSFLKVDLFYLKSIIFDFYKLFEIPIKFKKITNENLPDFIAKNNSLIVTDLKNNILGYIGQISPKITKENKIDEKLFFGEILADNLIFSERKNNFKINSNFSKTHDINRRLSFVLDNHSIDKLIESFEKCEYINSYNVIDAFKLNENETSYNIEFSILKDNKNADLEEINKKFELIINYFKKEGFKIKGVN